jgi:hypothetical protein
MYMSAVKTLGVQRNAGHFGYHTMVKFARFFFSRSMSGTFYIKKREMGRPPHPPNNHLTQVEKRPSYEVGLTPYITIRLTNDAAKVTTL